MSDTPIGGIGKLWSETESMFKNSAGENVHEMHRAGPLYMVFPGEGTHVLMGVTIRFITGAQPLTVESWDAPLDIVTTARMEMTGTPYAAETLTSDDPTRLALAVLQRDWAASLLLADHVQEAHNATEGDLAALVKRKEEEAADREREQILRLLGEIRFMMDMVNNPDVGLDLQYTFINTLEKEIKKREGA